MELFCGDCLEKLDNIANESIDLILADPPYGITACKWDAEIIPLDKMWQQLHRVIKTKAPYSIRNFERKGTPYGKS